MIFGPHHYVPVLKVKRGEKKALQDITASVRSRITPLFEIVEWNHKNVPTIDKHLETAFRDLDEAARRYTRCLLDARELEPAGFSAAAAVFEKAAAAGITFTPVTGLSRTADIASALVHRSNGIALRLKREEFEQGSLGRDVREFMVRHGLSHEEVDLIVDLGPVDELVYDGVATLATAFLADVPDKTRWRTFTLAACAFPDSMGGIERNSHSYAERNEWNVWRDELYANRRHLERLPTFSDCGIQHPKGVEGFDPRTMQASAAIRYALQRQWLLIKGAGTRVTPPSQQFPQLASRLVYGRHHVEFFGVRHCPGCAGMAAAADGASGLGSPEAWRRLGTIHHITSTVEGISVLPYP